MYIQKPLAETNPTALTQFMQDHSFATLAVTGEQGIEANHLPFEWVDDGSEFGLLRCHVAIRNPVWEMAMGNPSALVIFTGPHGYVSPDLHPASRTHGKVAPSWNYAAVHAYGEIKVIRDSNWVLQHLDGLTNANEAKRKTPWKMSDAPREYIEKSAEYVVGMEIKITKVQGKYQASQQYPQATRESIMAGLKQESGEAVANMVSSRNSLIDG